MRAAGGSGGAGGISGLGYTRGVAAAAVGEETMGEGGTTEGGEGLRGTVRERGEAPEGGAGEGRGGKEWGGGGREAGRWREMVCSVGRSGVWQICILGGR